jgi:hypothetical protein
MTKNESAERAARDKKSQDNKDRLQNEDKQRRSEANERRAISKQTSYSGTGYSAQNNSGSDTNDLTYLIGGVVLVFVLVFVLTLLGEVIVYLSNILSWVSYPFHFVFGNADFFDLKLLTGSQPTGGGLLVFSGQFWLDFLMFLLLTAGSIFAFYQIAIKSGKIWLAFVVYMVGSFITTNTNYIGNGLIDKNAQYIAQAIPSVVYLRGVYENRKRENAKLDAIEAKKKAKLDAIEAKKKAKLDAIEAKKKAKKVEKILSKSLNYDAYAKKLNASVNSLYSIKAINDKFKQVVESEIKRLGNNADLNHLDASNVTDMDSMFYNSKFNGDISKWDVSKVKKMDYMFKGSEFNGDISKWNVSKVWWMTGMFQGSKFNGDISKWDVSNLSGTYGVDNMFSSSKFNGDISGWAVKPKGYKRK